MSKICDLAIECHPESLLVTLNPWASFGVFQGSLIVQSVTEFAKQAAGRVEIGKTDHGDVYYSSPPRYGWVMFEHREDAMLWMIYNG